MKPPGVTTTSNDSIAISHSDQESTNERLQSLPQHGAEPNNLRVVKQPTSFLTEAHGQHSRVVDDNLEICAQYGLGTSSWAHVLAPSALQAVSAAKKEGFNVRPTSGTHAFGADGQDHVEWSGEQEA